MKNELIDRIERESNYFGPDAWWEHLQQHFSGDQLTHFHGLRKILIRYKLEDPTLVAELEESKTTILAVQQEYERLFAGAIAAWPDRPDPLFERERTLCKYGWNAGGNNGCDVLKGPCSCGSWHRSAETREQVQAA